LEELATVDYWKFLAGLGLFLFGMMQIEESLKNLAGRTFKKVIRFFTKNPVAGIINGTLATAVLQSSSIVTLMVLSFVGADILALRNALGIVLGANLGTTLKGWVVASVGFSASYEAFILPIIAIGSCGLIFLGAKFRAYHFFTFLVGLGLLFMGLETMNESVVTFSKSIDLSLVQGYGIFVYFVFGFFITAIIQSSSATMMLTLSALGVQMIELPDAVALVIGADLGTTITATIGAIGGTAVKKRVAAAHFFFNLVTNLLALSLMWVVMDWISGTLHVEDPLFALVAFHSTMNVMGILLFFPFLGIFEKFLNRLWVGDQTTVTQFISKIEPEPAEAAILAVKKDLHLFFQKVFSFIQMSLGGRQNSSGAGSNFVVEFLFIEREESRLDYERIKQTEGEMLKFMARLQAVKLEEVDSLQLQKSMQALRLAVEAAKAAKDIEHNIKDFKKSLRSDVEKFENVLTEHFESVQLGLKSLVDHPESVAKKDEIEFLLKEIEAAFQAVNTWIYTELQQDSNLATIVATMLNVNREIYNSHLSLLRALSEHDLNGSK
jgi:phosphate:Na+ symporter